MPSFQNTNQSKSERLLPLHLNFTRRKHGQRRKASRAMDKNAGSVFEQRNALALAITHLRDEVRNREGRAARDWL
ncbi:hypothetical protein CBI57_18610 [Pantoea agglomerans]|nr:hypothetical protein CBI57_18610 [Pantoea agglomerans]